MLTVSPAATAETRTTLGRDAVLATGWMLMVQVPAAGALVGAVAVVAATAAKEAGGCINDVDSAPCTTPLVGGKEEGRI